MFNDQLHNTEYKYWQKYFNDLKIMCNNEQKKKLYARSDNEWILPILPQQRVEISDDSDNDEVIPARIQKMLDEETEDPVVSYLLLCLKIILFKFV